LAIVSSIPPPKPEPRAPTGVERMRILSGGDEIFKTITVRSDGLGFFA